MFRDRSKIINKRKHKKLKNILKKWGDHYTNMRAHKEIIL